MKHLILPSILAAALPSLASAQCPGDDGVDNHTAATAEQLPPGATTIFNRQVLGVWNGLNGVPTIDWFRLDVGPGATAEVDLSYDFSVAGLYLQLYDLNIGFVQGTNPNTGTAFLSYTNTSNVTESFYLTIQSGAYFGGANCADYDLASRIQACPGDDTLENFDDCQSTYDLNNVPTTELERLAVLNGDDDWFGTTLMDGDRLDVSIFFSHATADLDLYLFDESSCNGNSLTSSISTTNDEFVTYTNNTGSQQAISIGVEYFDNGVGAPCNDYELAWEVISAPGDDHFEENDDICSPAAIDLGVYPGLIAFDGDSDFYSFDLSQDERVTVAIDFLHADGDMDIRLWDVSAGCNNAVLVDSSETITDYEEVFFTSVAPGLSPYVAEIYYFPTDGGNNEYQMTVGFGRAGDTGEVVCEGEFNSRSLRGYAYATGSELISDNALVLNCQDLPFNAFGYFLCSQAYGFVPNPNASVGNLCIAGGEIGRYSVAGQIMSSGTTGGFSLQIDLNNMPQPTGLIPALPGDSWFFQVWHRDSDGAGNLVSNFTSAVRVRLQ